MSSNSLCGLNIIPVGYMSSSGPGTCRDINIPSLNLSISEEWNVTDFVDLKYLSKSKCLSNPFNLFQLTDDQLEDITQLVKAKEAYEEAKRNYEKFKENFKKENQTGKWLNSLLIPDLPLAETLDARLSKEIYSQLISELKTISLEPDNEIITESKSFSTKFSEYSLVSIPLDFKIGIKSNLFHTTCNKLGFGIDIINSGDIITFAVLVYGKYYPPYREIDLKYCKEYDEKLKLNKKEYEKVGNYWIPLNTNKSISKELVNKYFEEQIAIYNAQLTKSV